VDCVIATVGTGGWVRLIAPDTGATVLVRAVEDEPGGRFDIMEVRVRSDRSVTGEALRAVPITHLKALINWPTVARRIRDRADAGDVPAFTPEALVPDPPPPVDLSSVSPADADYAREVDQRGEPSIGVTEFENDAVLIEATMPTRARDLKVRVPRGHKRPDSFYAQVAEVYGAAQATGPRPAVRLAKANGVPVSTIHRWMREARRRGVVGPGGARSGEQETK
jgi:hypothetical protein